MNKSELRKEYLARQTAISPLERTEKSIQIAERLVETFDLSKIRLLHCFIPIEKFNEVDTMPIFRAVWKNFPRVRTAVPRVNFESGEMESIGWAKQSELAKNAWGIHEPVHGEFVAAEDIDMVLVPLLCFDEAGHRVGYGKGFYDWFLAKCRPDCLKIGLSYFDPVNTIDDVHEGDTALDFCVTAHRILTPRCGGE